MSCVSNSRYRHIPSLPNLELSNTRVVNRKTKPSFDWKLENSAKKVSYYIAVNHIQFMRIVFIITTSHVFFKAGCYSWSMFRFLTLLVHFFVTF